MRPATLALLAFTSFLLATPAFANCTTTIYDKIASAYVLKDVAATGSTDPVIQGGFTVSCEKITVDGWGSDGKGLSTAQELDLSGFYDDQIGSVKYQLSMQYYFVNLGHSLLKTRDDIAEVYTDASVPHTYGKLTVAPMLRVVQMIGVKELPSLTLVQPGVRFSLAVTDKLILTTDLRDSINLTQHYSAVRWVGGASYQFTPHFAGELGYDGTSRTRSVVSVGFRYRY